jgi:peptidoglycan/xylan/chitin deacetylase (PgdA/CDA1 family)
VNPRFRAATGLKAIAVVVAIAIPLIAAGQLHDAPPPIQIWVGFHPHLVPRAATLGEVVRAFHVQAHSGQLLDVSGKPIPGHFRPGRILLNGHTARGGTRLHDQDQIWAANQRDHREPLERRRIELHGQQPADPQFYLGTSTGVQIVTAGRISGKVVSTTFEPTGPSHTPKAVALTFDDGPNPIDTPRILSILRRKHVTATFFTIGYLVQRYPQIVQREKKLGMGIADHTWNHPNSTPFRTLPPGVIRMEMEKAKLAVADLGVEARLFRPPGGSTSAEVETIAAELGMRVVLWSVDPRDWVNTITPNTIVHNVLSHVRAGSIVELHDGGGDQAATALALPRIIKGIRKRHLDMVPIL